MKGVRFVEVDDAGNVTRHAIDQVGNNLTCRLAWCTKHQEPVWVYGDGSFECPHRTAVGWDSDGEHPLTLPPWVTPRAFDIVNEGRRAAVACYAAVPEAVAMDLARIINGLADEIERLRAEVDRRRHWQEEAAVALIAATNIGCRHDTPLNYGNHDRLLRELDVLR